MKYFCIVVISALACLATSQAASVETPEKLTPPLKAPLKDAASLSEAAAEASTLPPIAGGNPPQNLPPKPRPAGPAGLSPLPAAPGRRPVRDAAEAELPSSSSTSTSTTAATPTTTTTTTATTSTETSVLSSESSSEPLPAATPSNATMPAVLGELVPPPPPPKLEAKENITRKSGGGGYGYSAMEHSKVEATTLLPETELNSTSTSTSTESVLPANGTSSGEERDARKFRKFFKVKFLG